MDSEEIDAVARERAYALEKWGEAFDNANTLNDWVTYSTMYATDASRMGHATTHQYGLLIKAAGLLLNAAERVRTSRVAPRHYEGQPSRGHGEGTAWKPDARIEDTKSS